jgi:hypothetical protein
MGVWRKAVARRKAHDGRSARNLATDPVQHAAIHASRRGLLPRHLGRMEQNPL